MRANVVDDPGMKPNWLGSTCFRITGFNSVSITILSAILDSVEVNEIGLKSLLKSRIIEDFGIPITFANFQTDGKIKMLLVRQGLQTMFQFQNEYNKVEIALRVVQFWSEIKLGTKHACSLLDNNFA